MPLHCVFARPNNQLTCFVTVMSVSFCRRLFCSRRLKLRQSDWEKPLPPLLLPLLLPLQGTGGGSVVTEHTTQIHSRVHLETGVNVPGVLVLVGVAPGSPDRPPSTVSRHRPTAGKDIVINLCCAFLSTVCLTV